MMWHRPVIFLLCLTWLLGGLVSCVPPRRARAPLPPPTEDFLQAQATEDCRFYRMSPYLPQDREEACIQRRKEAMQNIAVLRSDPYFAQAQQACAFFRGSPGEDGCYRAKMQERRMDILSMP